jgi:hypothetical protein
VDHNPSVPIGDFVPCDLQMRRRLQAGLEDVSGMNETNADQSCGGLTA